MRWFFLIAFIVSVTLFVGIGPRREKFSSPPFEIFPDMDHQYKVRYQKQSPLVDGKAAQRKPVPGTVPMGFVVPEGTAAEGKAVAEFGWAHSDDYFNTGTFGDYYGEGFPEAVTVDEVLLARGKQRFHINCMPCHGEAGNGQGVVSKYWAIPPTANLLDPRVVSMPEGQIFWTITHGKGLMGPYNGTITVKDRWAIVAYVKALQFASSAPLSNPEVKTLFDQAQAAPPVTAAPAGDEEAKPAEEAAKQ